jgi:hypothetical protein
MAEGSLCVDSLVWAAMAIRIFRTQRNARESWLAVNNDGSVTYHAENFGSRLKRVPMLKKQDHERQRSEVAMAFLCQVDRFSDSRGRPASIQGARTNGRRRYE